ncbi:non-ribosomal peptide synthetase [Pedosphaera parvula]|uniref:Amino acid adenylation domain protein n=1 Tax=Pedosphaera parvula (strain Ellin514) TaxID=320771 RepID=B9XAN7_PEDPL|nr:non-ribosomal peptide synthetase [Pedosphaera parvula]EEF63072.1 amino acid adenylation domain protein [Pedosphaera parvula Ellin514]
MSNVANTAARLLGNTRLAKKLVGQPVLSPAQKRLWMLEQLYPGQAFNNLSSVLKLEGLLHLACLIQSLSDIVQRHEVLGTKVYTNKGRPVISIAPALALNVPIEDLSKLPHHEHGVRANEIMATESCQPFDLSRDLLLRARILRVAPEEHLLLLTTHKLAADIRSFQILHQELATLYRAYTQHRPGSLPDVPFGYYDSAVLMLGEEDEILGNQLAYWKRKLKGKLPAIDLPTDNSRPTIQTYAGAQHRFALHSDLCGPLKALAQRLHTTLRVVLLAAFQILLHRWSGQEDILVGSPVSGRNEKTDRLIGPFENTLVFRTQLSGDQSFKAILDQVCQVVSEAEGNQDLRFENLLEALHLDQDISRSPIFQVMFHFESALPFPLEHPGLSMVPLPTNNNTMLYDLTLALREQKYGVIGSFVYNPNLFEGATILRMLGNFQTLLEGIIADPNEAISRLPLLTKAETYQLLVEWNDTQAHYATSRCVHHLFEEQVHRTPEAVAAVYEDKHLTYQQLNLKANKLARELQECGVGPDVRVGVFMNRSLEMIVGLYAIHKAGGAYVPLAPSNPPERLAFMLEDAQVPVLLTQPTLLAMLPPTTAKVISLDQNLTAQIPPNGSEVEATTEASLQSDLKAVVTPENLAYVIYTSGSTGKPKGVMVRHCNVVNFFAGMDRVIGREPGVWLALTSISFDISVLELFWTLSCGFKAVIQGDDAAGAHTKAIPPNRAAAIEHKYTIPEQILRYGVTHLQCTPSLAGIMLEEPKTAAALRNVKKFLFGGEPLPPTLVEKIAGFGELLNMYGPTETTIWSTTHSVTREDDLMSIGRPIANTEIYILDAHLQPVPVGVAGELFIGGAGVARGYLNRPELTAERFIQHPFKTTSNRLYRTGDLARYRHDGKIEYLERLDHQVKLRGFRIELGEIEAALGQHPSIKESVVSVWEARPNDKRLVGYCVAKPSQEFQAMELRRFLKTKLPEYMVPSILLQLDALPLTPNGKIDRKALPTPELRHASESLHVPPQTHMEKCIAAIWQELLHIEQIGTGDDFFDLGGNSLMLVEAHARVCEQLNLQIPLSKFFQVSNIAALAKYIVELSRSSNSLSKMKQRALRQRQALALRKHIKQ